MTVYFLGGGNMAAAIAGGLVRQGGYQVHIANRGAEKREHLARELGVGVSETLPLLTADDVLVLAVKPQDMQAACANVQTNGALVISVAAGLDIRTLSAYLGGTRRIVRAMPNLPAKIGLGITGLFAAPDVAAGDKVLAEAVMSPCGATVWLDNEEMMHAFTGICGSGSGYVFYLMNALQQAARAQGFDDDTARTMVLETFDGAVALSRSSGSSFADLQRSVMSKGGTTTAAIETFDAHHAAEALAAGVDACVARSQQMAQQFKAV